MCSREKAQLSIKWCSLIIIIIIIICRWNWATQGCYSCPSSYSEHCCPPPPLLWKQFRSRRASETIFHLQDSYPCPPGTPPRQLFIHVWLTPWLKLLCTEARRGLFPPLLPISSHKSRNMVSAKLHHNKFKKFGYSILRHFTEKCALEQAYHKKFKWKKVRN